MPISGYNGSLTVQYVALFYVHDRLSLYMLSVFLFPEMYCAWLLLLQHSTLVGFKVLALNDSTFG